MGRIIDWFLGRETQPVRPEVHAHRVHHPVRHSGTNAAAPRPTTQVSTVVRPTTTQADDARRLARQREAEEDARRRKQRQEDDSGLGIVGAVVAAEVLSSMFDSPSTSDTGGSFGGDSGFGGFDGGSSGGGGASGSW